MDKAIRTTLRPEKKVFIDLFTSGIGARLPPAYKKFYDEWKKTPPAPVHYKPHEGSKWQRDLKTGEIKRIENIPLPLRFPGQFHNIFTGGENIVQGFVKKNTKYSSRIPRFWTPHLRENVVYSEIFNKYFSVISTRRVLDLITENEGFDHYILKTKACDLQSYVALKFKQRLLKALNDRQLPYDEEKNKKIFEKYEKYLIPPEEIEWYSLSFSEACAKQKKLEEQQAAASIVPLKHFYRAELIKYLREKSAEEPDLPQQNTSWSDKLPKFLKLSGTVKKN